MTRNETKLQPEIGEKQSALKSHNAQFHKTGVGNLVNPSVEDTPQKLFGNSFLSCTLHKCHFLVFYKSAYHRAQNFFCSDSNIPWEKILITNLSESVGCLRGKTSILRLKFFCRLIFFKPGEF